MPLAEALARLTGALAPVPPARVPPAEALGAAAAADVPAKVELPAAVAAARDGWAVSFADIAGASPYSPIVPARTPAWTEAGGALPEGADTVLPPEAVDAETGEVTGDAPQGDGAAPAGFDLRRGDALVQAGERLGPTHLLALASAGIAEVEVRRPRLRLVATRSDGIDALGPALAALAAASGSQVMEEARPRAGVAAIAEAICGGDADAVLVLGGTGLGRTDWGAAALAEAGSVTAHGIALRPGETAGFGEAAGRPVLLLPGRPDAALAVFLALGRPLIDALAGAAEPPPRRAPLVRKVSSAIGLSEMVFVRMTLGGLEPLGSAGLPLRRLLQASGAVLVPPDREGYPDEEMVELKPL